jgi:hypothetical protein
MIRYYILNENKELVSVDDVLTWAEWFETTDRTVATSKIGDVKVSTIVVGLDNCLFETVVFGGSLDGEEMRYRTWDEAVRGHEEMVRRVNEQR